MADNGTSFSITLGVVGADKVGGAAAQLEKLTQKMTTAQAAASKAAEAVKAQEQAFKTAETTYDKASKGLEKVSLAIESITGKKLEALKAQQTAAASAATNAKTALDSQASAFEGLKSKATEAAKALDVAKGEASATANAVRSQEGALRVASNAYDQATNSLKKIELAMAGASGKKLDDLQAKHVLATNAVSAASAAVEQESAALARLQGAAQGATGAYEAAAKAADDASNAVRAGEASYNAASDAYAQASRALDKVNASVNGAGAKLANLQQEQTRAAAAVQAAKTAMDAEASSLDKLKASATAANTQVDHIAKSQSQAQKAIDDQKKSQEGAIRTDEALGAAFGRIGGPLGRIGQQAVGLKGAWDKLSKTMGSAGPYVAIGIAVAAIAVGVAAVTAAVVIGLAKITAWAVGLADAARNQELLNEGVAQSVTGGAALTASIADLSKRVPQSRQELQSMAEQLAKTGLTGKDLTKTLEANAVAAAELKFGPEWSKQMLSLDQQQKKLHDSVSDLFGGLKIDKLLEQLSTLVDLFDSSTASGHAIKVVFESIFQPAIDGATGFVPVIRHAFLQFEILVLRALIAIKPWGSTLLKAAEVVGVIALAVGGVLAAAIASVIVTAAVFAGIVGVIATAIVAAAIGIGQMIAKLYELGATIVNTIGSISLVDIGKHLIEGLAQGITGGASAVVDAVKGAAEKAVGAAKKALGIASPSTVFKAEVGTHIAGGIAAGVSDNADEVGDAIADATSPKSALERAGSPGALPVPALERAGAEGASGATAAAPGAQAGAAPASDSGGKSGDTYNIYMGAGGASGGGEDFERIKQVILTINRGAVVQLGAAVPV